MVLTKCKDVTKQGTVKYSEENSLFREVSILGGSGRGKWGGSGHLFEFEWEGVG